MPGLTTVTSGGPDDAGQSATSTTVQPTPPMAHLQWQKPANGSDILATAQIRWHRTFLILIANTAPSFPARIATPQG
jgi:hypothetical protein